MPKRCSHRFHLVGEISSSKYIVRGYRFVCEKCGFVKEVKSDVQ